ncbi:hypothetical protein SAMN06265379_1262 [Saccharicrinis carchari]|uniref:Lipoprotein n=1 Tax=Saccharicrinis carchari TaxID=1168039 RepID=A0A521FF73_SACCC|nr:hypothetical protein [Saccharicrinis carchari]SMO94832.1 hypothetical protein SAMN06265379_1262 [Saccharicrinis carchari]
MKLKDNNNTMRLTLGLLLIFTITSCSSGIKTELSINCLCSVTEHYSISTDSEDNRTKEYTFTNSPIFKLGVPKEYFATSCAILINNNSKIDSTTILKINLLKDKGGSKENTFFRYDIYELGDISPKYFEMLEIMNHFVESIYSAQYQVCHQYIGFEFDKDNFDTVMNQIKEGLERGYVDTRIIGFDKHKDNYSIYGGIYTENKILDLFTMKFRETADGLKITSFKF